MADLGYFDPVQRRQEKARARAADDRALRDGQIARDEIRMRNSFLAPLAIVSSHAEHQSAYL